MHAHAVHRYGFFNIPVVAGKENGRTVKAKQMCNASTHNLMSFYRRPKRAVVCSPLANNGRHNRNDSRLRALYRPAYLWRQI